MAGNLDQAAARKVPTYSANKFLIESDAQGVRLSFGEEWDGKVSYHFANRLSFEDALQLHAVLGQVLSAKPKSSS